MSFFGIGLTELLLIFVLALIFIGPGKMPEVAAQIGKALREFQKASAELTEALNAEVAAAQAAKAALENSVAGNHTADISDAEIVATAPAEPEPAVAAPSLDSLTITPVQEIAPEVPLEPPAEPVAEPAAPQPVTPPVDDPTGMAPLPQALLEPSDSMRGLKQEVAVVVPSEPSAPIASNGKASPVNGMSPLPGALLEPSDSMRGLSAVLAAPTVSTTKQIGASQVEA